MPSTVRISAGSTIQSSGLDGALNAAFQTYYNNEYTLDWTFTGSGGCMDNARNGLADIVLTHDRVGEHIFLGERYAFQREVVFWNWFVLVGPQSSAVFGTLTNGFTAIAAPNNLPFVSRGLPTLSGTYVRERQIWKRLGLTPSSNYTVPQGSAPGGAPNPTETLQYADLNSAYTLVDIGTWYQYLLDNPGTNLKVLTNPIQDRLGTNQYSLMPVNPDACFLTAPATPINAQGAEAFVDWLLSNAPPNTNNGMETVNGYLIGGNQAFFYNAEMIPTDRCLIQYILNNL